MRRDASFVVTFRISFLPPLCLAYIMTLEQTAAVKHPKYTSKVASVSNRRKHKIY